MTRILPIDPGGKTGWVQWDGPRMPYGSFRPDHNWMGAWGEIGPEKHHRQLWDLLYRSVPLDGSPPLIIGERFDPRQNPAAKLISKEYIGVLELFEQTIAEYSPGGMTRPIVWQGPSQKDWATDDKLERLGLLIKPKSKWKNANDAMRHLVVYICTGDIQGDTDLIQTRHYMLQRLKETGPVES